METFDIRKKAILEKVDKSNKGEWDSRIVEFCDKLNEENDYYTTSSCSGKSVIMPDKIGRDGSYYLWTSHDLLNFDEFKEIVFNLKEKDLLKFKSEGPILFVACRDLNSAKILLELAKEIGFKQSGINVTDKLIGVEIKSGEKLEFPLSSRGKILVSKEFLGEVVLISNYKRKSGWEKLEKLFLKFQ